MTAKHKAGKGKAGPAVFFCILLLSGILLSGCGKRVIQPVTKSAFLLNTFVTVTLYDSDDMDILNGALDLCREYEMVFSRTREDSELYAINHRPPKTQSMEVSDDMAALLEKGLYYSELSGGSFDITIEPVSSLWDFTDEKKVPPKEEIEEGLEKVGYENLKLEGNTLTFLSDDVAIDLGAIAKGYIADRMKDYLKEEGVESAIINLGGNVLCLGKQTSGEPFRVGLRDPKGGADEVLGSLAVDDLSVVSSGVYERCFVEDGINYHHLLDPSTGYPYQNGLESVTILSPLSVDGDGLSTTCFSLGLEKGMELLDSLEDIYGIFMETDGTLHYSQGAEQFLIQEAGGSQAASE